MIASKAETIERCVARIREEHVGHEHEFVDNFTRQDAIILNLQRACEASTGMANRTIKLRRLRYPRDSKESFSILGRMRLLSPELTSLMESMVGFRNIAVRQCQELDLTKVRGIIEHRLDDLLAFSRAMLQLSGDAQER